MKTYRILLLAIGLLLAPFVGIAGTAANNSGYVSTARRQSVVISVANPNRDGTGTLSTLFLAGVSYPGRVDAIQIAAASSTTAGMIRVYINTVLIDEIPVPTSAPSATVKTWVYTYTPPAAVQLNPSDVLQVSTQNAETFNVTAFGWSY